MKILSICPAIPAQDAKGFQVQAYYRLIHLARKHAVNVVCYGQGEADEARKRILTDAGIRVLMLPWHRTCAILAIIKAIFDRNMPLQCALFNSSAFRTAVQKILHEDAPDVIHATTIRVLPNLANLCGPLILDLVDSMGLNFRRRAERAPWWQRPIWYLEQARVAYYERAAAKSSVASFVVSAVDKNEIDIDSVHILPLGIDAERFCKVSPSTEPIVVLTGNMAYRPNIEAAVWMARECWPAIKSTVQNAKFVIAGNRPDSSVKDLEKDPSIRVTGQVPEMSKVLQSAQVAVAPMQSGSGMQFKILEAMACGIPVITSTLGLGDIKAIPGVDLLVSDSPSDFSNLLLRLLQSKEERIKIGDSGLDFVRSSHSWDAINTAFEHIALAECSLSPSDKT